MGISGEAIPQGEESLIVIPHEINIDIVIPWDESTMADCTDGSTSTEIVCEAMLITELDKICEDLHQGRLYLIQGWVSRVVSHFSVLLIWFSTQASLHALDWEREALALNDNNISIGIIFALRKRTKTLHIAGLW